MLTSLHRATRLRAHKNRIASELSDNTTRGKNSIVTIETIVWIAEM